MDLKRKYPEFVTLTSYVEHLDQAIAEGGVGNCKTGRLLMNIDNRGNVARCTERLDEPVGNILTDDIATIRDRLGAAHRYPGLRRMLDLLPRVCREHVHAAADAAVPRVLPLGEAALTSEWPAVRPSLAPAPGLDEPPGMSRCKHSAGPPPSDLNDAYRRFREFRRGNTRGPGLHVSHLPPLGGDRFLPLRRLVLEGGVALYPRDACWGWSSSCPSTALKVWLLRAWVPAWEAGSISARESGSTPCSRSS